MCMHGLLHSAKGERLDRHNLVEIILHGQQGGILDLQVKGLVCRG